MQFLLSLSFLIIPIILLMKQFNKIVLNSFCLRQFKPDAANCIPCSPQQFEVKVNEYYQNAPLQDGYAPFCKHIFIDNFVEAKLGVLEITPQNEHLLRSAYEARNQKELPVLKRYFPKNMVVQRPAKYLDIILYSKAQVLAQDTVMGNFEPNADINYDYGVISVKPTDCNYETPMDPITIMRNALGKEFGGSGVPLNHQAYLLSVKYWSTHALIN